jgi:hypothetical protein
MSPWEIPRPVRVCLNCQPLRCPYRLRGYVSRLAMVFPGPAGAPSGDRSSRVQRMQQCPSPCPVHPHWRAVDGEYRVMRTFRRQREQ